MLARVREFINKSNHLAIGKFLDKRGEGLHHVALKVPDLNAAIERLRASGARLLNDPAQAQADIYMYLCIRRQPAGF